MPISILILPCNTLPTQTADEQPGWMSDRHVYLLLNLTEHQPKNNRTIGLKLIRAKLRNAGSGKARRHSINSSILDHTEYMALALQLYDVYRESILGFSSKKALAGNRIVLVSLTLMSS